MQTRNNAASLLHDLLADEQNVSKILLVKSPGPDSKALVEMIARMAAVNLKKLELLSTNDPDLDLSETDLPPGEQASRNAEAKTKEHALLFSSGADFEFNLLLTQAEALNYGANLAAVAADNSPPSEEAQVFKAINGVMAGLYKQVVLQMRSLPAK